MIQWKAAAGETSGFHWFRRTGRRGIRYLMVDVNFWKTFVHNGLNLGDLSAADNLQIVIDVLNGRDAARQLLGNLFQEVGGNATLQRYSAVMAIGIDTLQLRVSTFVKHLPDLVHDLIVLVGATVVFVQNT